MKYHPLKFAAFLLLAMFAIIARAEQAIPPIGWIADPDNILTQQDRNKIAARAAITDAQTKAVMATIIIQSLDGEDIASYAQRAAEAWSPGYEGDNRGAILVISAGDRKVRIATTRNISQTFTDSRAAQVIDAMKPDLKKKDWTAAILTFYDKAQPYAGLTPEAARQQAVDDENSRRTFGYMIGGFFLLFAIVGGAFWYFSAKAAKKREAEEAEYRRRKNEEWEAAERVRREDAARRHEREVASTPAAPSSKFMAALEENPHVTSNAALGIYSASDRSRTPPRRTAPTHTPTPPPPRREETRRRESEDDGFAAAAAIAAAAVVVASSSRSSSRSSDDDNRSSWSSPSSPSSDNSGGGSYDGGGASSDF